jgi:hypothetical protein
VIDPQTALENYLRYRDDAWAFITECVRTKDEVDKNSPIKPFPNKEYLQLYTKIWQRYPLLAIPKTRRMTMSWMTISLYVWDTIFHKGRFTAFVSKKEDDADFLVKRAKFIIDNLDREKLSDNFIPKYKEKFCVLEFPEIDSKIQGFPQGADQLRQFTFSGIFGDECAFWEQAQEFYSASFPTIDGGGRMTLVSSPAPGFFKRLCFDALDRIGDVNTSDFRPDSKAPMQGVRVWQNRKNKFLIYELHYTADPTKRDPAYKESIKNSMPLQEYLREYELHWDTFAGMPVYPEFGSIHITRELPMPLVGLPMLAAFDFGLTPACVIGQFAEGELLIFREYVEINMGAERFLKKVTDDLRLRYRSHTNFKKDWLCFIDPSGFFRSDTDESSCAQEVNKYFNATPGPVAWDPRRKAVANFLIRLNKGTPAFQIYEKDCPVLVKGFQGGYRFSDKAFEIEPNKVRPIKDAYSHPHDALQYLAAGVDDVSEQTKKQVPRPEYFKR